MTEAREAREAIVVANLKASKMDHFMRDYFDVDAFLTALSEAGYVVEQGWRPIESAPRDGTGVHLWGVWAGEINGIAPRVSGPFVGSWIGGRSDFDGDDWWRLEEGDAYACWCRPTHWRPLPTPPAKGGDDE